jgi:hypothetical protein
MEQMYTIVWFQEPSEGFVPAVDLIKTMLRSSTVTTDLPYAFGFEAIESPDIETPSDSFYIRESMNCCKVVNARSLMYTMDVLRAMVILTEAGFARNGYCSNNLLLLEALEMVHRVKPLKTYEKQKQDIITLMTQDALAQKAQIDSVRAQFFETAY